VSHILELYLRMQVGISYEWMSEIHSEIGVRGPPSAAGGRGVLALSLPLKAGRRPVRIIMSGCQEIVT
jgi:hypothetical protein